MPEDTTKDNWFMRLLILSSIAVVVVSFYFFYFKKDYTFIVETSCDKDSEGCLFRDCSVADTNCPPNNFSYYRRYQIRARDFAQCTNEDCTEVCASGAIVCTPTEDSAIE